MATSKKKEEKLEFEDRNGWLAVSDKEKKDIFAFAEDYMEYLDASKTERAKIQIEHMPMNHEQTKVEMFVRKFAETHCLESIKDSLLRLL